MIFIRQCPMAQIQKLHRSIRMNLKNILKFLDAGKDILHVTLSSGISGVYNSAKLAAEDLSTEYPERKIYIVDSLAASSGYGLLMDKLSELRASGMSIDELEQCFKIRTKKRVIREIVKKMEKAGGRKRTIQRQGLYLSICMPFGCKGCG